MSLKEKVLCKSHETWRVAYSKCIELNRLPVWGLCLAGWQAGYVCHATGMCHASLVWPNHEGLIPLCRTWQPETIDEQLIVDAKLP